MLLGGGTWRNEIWKSAVAQVAWARPWRNHLPGFERRRGCTWTRHTSQHPHRVCSVSAALVIVALTHLCLLLAVAAICMYHFQITHHQGSCGKIRREELNLGPLETFCNSLRTPTSNAQEKLSAWLFCSCWFCGDFFFFFQEAMNTSCWVVKENDWFNHWPFNKDLGWWTQHLNWDQLFGPSQGCVRTDVSGGWCPVLGPGARPAEHAKCCPLGLPCFIS